MQTQMEFSDIELSFKLINLSNSCARSLRATTETTEEGLTFTFNNSSNFITDAALREQLKFKL